MPKFTFPSLRRLSAQVLPLVLLGTLPILSYAQSADAPAAKCRYVKMAEMSYQLKNRTPILQGEVNAKPTRFLLDTGAVMTSLFQHYVNKQGWPMSKSPTRMVGVGGVTEMYTVLAENVAIDKITRPRMRMRVIADHQDDSLVDGLVGADFLMQRDLELDFAAQKVRFFQALESAPCAQGFLAYWDQQASVIPLLSAGMASDLRPVIEVMLHGKKVRALLDTGAMLSVLNLSAAQAMGVKKEENAPEKTLVGLGKAQAKVYAQKFEHLIIGNEDIAQVVIGVADLRSSALANEKSISLDDSLDARPELVLGMDFLKNYRLLVANSQAKLYLTRIATPSVAAPAASAASN